MPTRAPGMNNVMNNRPQADPALASDAPPWRCGDAVVGTRVLRRDTTTPRPTLPRSVSRSTVDPNEIEARETLARA